MVLHIFPRASLQRAISRILTAEGSDRNMDVAACTVDHEVEKDLVVMDRRMGVDFDLSYIARSYIRMHHGPDEVD